MRNPAPAMRATLRPMRPRPTRPSVLPERSSPIHCASGQAQPSPSIARWIGFNRFASAIISAIAPSATVSSAYSGTFTTGMPRAFAASMSIASIPTPYFTMPFRRGAAAMTRAVTGV